MPNQAWYDGLKKGFNPDGTVNKSFTYLKDGKNTYADGTPAPTAYESSQAFVAQQQAKNDSDRERMWNEQWAPYGGAPAMNGRNATSGYIAKNDGSDAWKFKGSMDPSKMKNPIWIKSGFYNNGSYYDMPIAKTTPAANLSGGQATVPTVEQRMSRMGQAVQKGVSKGKIKSNQLAKYQVPGQTAPASPLVNQLGKGPGSMPNKNLPDANEFASRIGYYDPNSGGYAQYRGTAGNDQLATREFIRRTPASTEEFVKALTPQGFKNMGY